MKINTRSITLAATLTALCAVTGAIPFVFFLPVTVAATTLSVGMAAFVGLAFGCISLAYSYIMPMSVVSTAFTQAPYLAIIPRIVAALAAVGMYRLMVKLLKPSAQANPKRERGRYFASASVAAATGSLVNTALVVSLLVLIMPSMQFGEVTVYAYAPTMLISGAIECVCMAVLTPPISMTLQKHVLNKKRKRRVENELVDNKSTGNNADEQSADNSQQSKIQSNAD